MHVTLVLVPDGLGKVHIIMIWYIVPYSGRSFHTLPSI